MSKANTAIDQSVEQMAMKQRQKATWEDGDYALFATYMEAGAIEILDDWAIPAGTKLLDIACGAGQTAIPAAKQGCQVTGIDIADNLVTHARHRAVQSRLNVQFDIGDAQDLPYENHCFDVAMSMFGTMFAPQPKRVTDELSRVIKPGGRLYMTNWVPGSMPAQMFKLLSDVNPPPTKVIPPVLWGDEATVKQRLTDKFVDIQLQRKIYPQWHFPFDANELAIFFRQYFGPAKRAFDAIDVTERVRLHERLTNLYRRHSETHNGILTITGGEYLEVIATRR